MKCKNCGKKMIKVSLKFSSFVGIYKYAYICLRCNKENKDANSN